MIAIAESGLVGKASNFTILQHDLNSIETCGSRIQQLPEVALSVQAIHIS